jgi:DNA-binding response OmpR family regulator
MLTVSSMTNSQATVLVVDDSTLVLDIVRDALEARGYRVETTSDPLECERMFSEVEPDVLVVDIEMPVLDGASLIRLIQRKRLHHCVALLFSDRSHAELTATIRACEADGGAKKTPDCGDLISLIDSKLAKRRKA